MDPSSVKYVELLDKFAGTALQSGYDACAYVDFCDKECFFEDFVL